MTNTLSQNLPMITQHIDKAARDLAQQQGEDIGSLIYMGSHQDAMPRALILDPLLESGEVHTWMLMKINVDNPLNTARIPSQDTLMEQLKASRPIVSRHMQVLRTLRWITLCAEVRGSDGQYRGVVYAQHDTPLSLQDTLTLDAGYLDFLEQMPKGDVFKRVRVIKEGVLHRISDQILEQHIDLSTSPTLLQQFGEHLVNHVNSANANHTDTHLACSRDVLNSLNLWDLDSGPVGDVQTVDNSADHRDKNFNTVNIEESDHDKNFNTVENGENHRVKNFNTVKSVKLDNIQPIHRDKNFNTVPVVSSCSLNNNKFIKTTTTTTTTESSKLDFPKVFRSRPKQMALASRMLEKLPEQQKHACLDWIPEKQRQFALDWMADRNHAAENRTDKPVGNQIRLLGWLISAIQNGTLEPSSYGFRDTQNQSQSAISRSANTETPEDKARTQQAWRDQMRQLGYQFDDNGQLVKGAVG